MLIKLVFFKPDETLNKIGLLIEEDELEEPVAATAAAGIVNCEFEAIWFERMGVVDKILRLDLFGLDEVVLFGIGD